MKLFLRRFMFSLMLGAFSVGSVSVLVIDRNAAIIDHGFGFIVNIALIGLIPYFVVMQIVSGDAFCGSTDYWANAMVFWLAVGINVYLYIGVGRFLDYDRVVKKYIEVDNG